MAFSTILLTELEWACRKRPEFVRGNSEVFLFCLNNFSIDKTPQKVDRY